MFSKEKKKVVYIGSDHAGFSQKNEIKDYLISEGYEVTDLGCFTEEPCDYPDIAREVSEKVLERNGADGILLCGTGIGMSMAANKLQGIRAVTAMDENMAEMSKRHNNANVLALAGRSTDIELNKKIADKFLTTEFEGSEERHVRRVKKIDGV